MRVLVAYSLSSTFVQTTMDYLTALRKHLKAEVDYVHVTHGAIMDFDLAQYDVVFHNYCSRLCFPDYVSDHYQAALKAFDGLKILAVQDEYDETNALRAAILNLGFDVVLTCVPNESLDFVYPARDFGHVRFERVLTGYVGDDFAESHTSGLPLRERPIRIGYRGRDIGGRYGRLGYEKYIIGVRMKDICEAEGVACDIAVDEGSRIYGSAWFDFVGSCRAMLGSESGSNVFDFDGSIARTYRDMASARGGVVSYDEFEPIVREHEDKIHMGQISPRVFECAVMRTPMVLFQGRYSDAIEPETHYIPLEKDFSNAKDVLKRLEDIDALEAMADRAFDHLVRSGAFGYPRFVARIEQVMREGLAAKKKRAPSLARPALPDPRTVLLRGQRPTPLPGNRQDFDDEQNRYLATIYGDETTRLQMVLDDHLKVLRAEIARLEQVFQESLDNNKVDAHAATALPRARFDDVCAQERAAAAAFNEARSSLLKRSETAPSGSWKALSDLCQSRIAALNAHLGILNDVYQDLVGRLNVLILANALDAQDARWGETEQAIAAERVRLEQNYSAEFARIASAMPGDWNATGLPGVLQWLQLPLPRPVEDIVARMRASAYDLQSGSLDWSSMAGELQTWIAENAREQGDYLAGWEQAARTAATAFSDLAAAYRRNAMRVGGGANVRVFAIGLRLWGQAAGMSVRAHAVKALASWRAVTVSARRGVNGLRGLKGAARALLRGLRSSQ